ncbi:DNA recombination protein RmuC [Exilibacterium tricleocarpae]|uniref:DNA recombination protein RmuC n=1 Tax=Exilibacterium tricleocarpae TaxID=2591008 RepID=A0A545T8L8_9GAMM|nr:DNA recombination protein RmuC [Exilibacterium tricleocarpae]
MLDNVNLGEHLPLIALLAGVVIGVALVALLWRHRIGEARELARYHTGQESAARIAGLEQEIAALNRELTAGQAQISRARAEADALRGSLEQQREQHHQLKTQQAVSEEQHRQEKRHFEEQLRLLTEARAQLTREFENLAHKIFDQKQTQFTQQSKQALDVTLGPVKQQLQDFRRKVEDVYEKENAERNKLVGQITELQKQTRQIGEDAVNLANALKGDNKAQGNWGEVVLERLLEESGLQKGREYETQVRLTSAEGRRRNPDVIVRLPENKDLIIDAKVSLLDYDRYCSSDSDEDRRQALKQHIASLRTHINHLSVKDYEKLEQVRTLDFVFIFIPVEAAFMLALQHEPNLFREAYDKHIILVSPTTLLATLRTVEGIWRYEKQNKNAEKIARQAGSLYDQFVLLVGALEEVGKNIDKTQQAYSTVQKRLVSGRGNLVKRVEDIKLLGAKTKKALDAELLADAGQAPALDREAADTDSADTDSADTDPVSLPALDE